MKDQFPPRKEHFIFTDEMGTYRVTGDKRKAITNDMPFIGCSLAKSPITARQQADGKWVAKLEHIYKEYDSKGNEIRIISKEDVNLPDQDTVEVGELVQKKSA